MAAFGSIEKLTAEPTTVLSSGCYRGSRRPCAAWRLGVWVVALQAAIPAAQATLDPAKAIRQYTHQVWDSSSGLPQSSVLSIAQTPDGYLWVGTEEGLARFDGVRFAVFDKRNTPGLVADEIHALLADNSGNLWIGTHGGGLSCLRDGKITSYSTRNGLPSDAVTSLYQDARGAIWIATDGGGLARLEHGRFRVFTAADGLLDPAVFSVSGDTQGNIWIGTRNGLNKFSGGKLSAVNVSPAVPHPYVRAVLVDAAGTMWIGTNGEGLFRVGSQGTARLTTREGLSSNSILSLYEDRAHTIWIGTVATGIDRFANGRIACFTPQDGFPQGDVWSLFEDREGTLWVGTARGGLNSFKNGSFAMISKQDGLPSDVTLGTYEDSNGALWIGSDHGLTRWKDGAFTSYSRAQGLADDTVFSISEDGHGYLWIGTRKGLSRLGEGQFTTFTSRDGLPSDFVSSTFTDNKGELWIGSRGGLTHFDGHRFLTYTTRDGLSNNNVLFIAQDRRGKLWIGTGGGLNRFDNGQFTSFTTRDGLSSDIVRAIYPDSDGTLWLATNGGGLDCFRNGHFTAFTADHGLPDDSLFQVLDDHLGRLWLTSNKGIFELGKKQLNAFVAGKIASVSPTVYGTGDGMKTRECNGGFQPAGCRRRDGRLCFPTMGGVAIVDPARVIDRGVSSPVVMERVLVDNKEVPLGKVLVVPPGQGKLEFQFTSPTFIAPENLRFRYMLEGFDKDWTQAGTRRVAYYTNIPHGIYRFVVRAGEGENWSTTDTSLSITLQPHYYETKAFYILVTLSLLSLFGAAYRMRVSHLKLREERLVRLVNERTSALQESERQLRHSRDELELRVEERTSELSHANRALEAEIGVRRLTEEQLIIAKEQAESANRAKTEFLQNMSHEIRTPINGILGMTEITLTTDLNVEQREYLEIVKISADSLLGVVNQILDFSKIEAGKLTLECAPLHLRGAVNQLMKSVSLRARQKGLALHTRIHADVPDNLIGDPLRMRQVLLNLVDNAIKFTSKGSVSVSIYSEWVSKSETFLHFSVADTGIGIPASKTQAVFEPFSQADTSSTRRFGGTGLGLTICSQLVEMMGGRLWVESVVNQGSTFHFTGRFELMPEADDVDTASLVSGEVAPLAA